MKRIIEWKSRSTQCKLLFNVNGSLTFLSFPVIIDSLKRGGVYSIPGAVIVKSSSVSSCVCVYLWDFSVIAMVTLHVHTHPPIV